MRVWQTVSHDPAEDAWESSVSLVEYPPDLGDLSVDRWRETPEPGPQSAAVLRASLEADALETPDEPT